MAFAIAPGVLLAGIAGGIAFPIPPVVEFMRAGLPIAFIGVILAADPAPRGSWPTPSSGTSPIASGDAARSCLGLLLQIVVMGFYWAGRGA